MIERQTIEVEEHFKLGPRTVLPSVENGSPWKEFSRDPVDWCKSIVVVAASALVILAVLLPLLLLAYQFVSK